MAVPTALSPACAAPRDLAGRTGRLGTALAWHGQVGLLHLQHPGLNWDPVHRQKGLLHRVRAGSECREGTCFAIAATPDLSLTFMSSRANRGFTHKDVRASVPLRRTSFISRSRTSPPVPRVALASVSALPACTFRARPAAASQSHRRRGQPSRSAGTGGGTRWGPFSSRSPLGPPFP